MFLFGTDSAAPTDQSKYMRVFYQYAPLWKALDPETSRKVRLRNYERLLDEAPRSPHVGVHSHPGYAVVRTAGSTGTSPFRHASAKTEAVEQIRSRISASILQLATRAARCHC